MDCHRCEHIVYSGCHYGRCGHPGHQDVVLARTKGEKRPYNRQICPDFVLKRRCSNCRYWKRGTYFADGCTPALKGKCSLEVNKDGKQCPIWAQGSTTWRKARPKPPPAVD